MLHLQVHFFSNCLGSLVSALTQHLTTTAYGRECLILLVILKYSSSCLGSYGGRSMPLGTLWPESRSREILNLVLIWLPPFLPLIQSVNPLHRMVTAMFSDVFSLASTLESPSTLHIQMILNPVS